VPRGTFSDSFMGNVRLKGDIPAIMLHVAQKLSKKSNNKEIGNLGEKIAGDYLKNKGFSIIEYNYLKKWGEIDIVTRGTDKIHFIEVKTVSYETKQLLKEAVTRRTWRPEENVHAFKIKKMSRAIESWLSENKCSLDWQIDVIALRVVPREKFASIKYIPNVII
jgi:putative endonuclease